MTYILKNKNLELHIDDPLKHYDFPRFDWTGKLTLLKYKGVLVSGNEKIKANEIEQFGRGFYNEFGINTPIGFDEIAIDDWFHKIGVGLLRKDKPHYFFLNNYDTDPAIFNVKAKDNSIVMSCKGQFKNGYAYLLEKKINLLENGFIVHYTLKNSGDKPIVTKEYNHNFLAINNNLIGKDYRLSFDFEINPSTFNDLVNPNNVMTLNGQHIMFKHKPESDFFISNISGGKLVKAKWCLEDTKNKIGITEEANFKTNSINLWGCGHVISPELFIDINIAPSTSKSWTRQYSIYQLD
ncbi:hypothetical protein [Winogradskyella alexanderae]|uniref:Galactose mutarotase-like enzyme n=1 Tax=Winogradskyella alexanderae TaxID=2877123 RepID=A0ABS7XTZ8_9FLAO|nr:hypothetical protein [Winogradskyella alexanderae]MCA0133498.1 hypothetical protein [Winogradskyella alexanderae]